MFVVLFIAILGALVLVHEAGHFFAARKAGVRVEEFGFGIPPRVWGKKIGNVLYSLNLLPIGGFVKIFGEEGEHKDDVESFASKRSSVRVGILAAGVLMNVLLAWVLFSVGHAVGLPTALQEGEINSRAKNIGVQIVEVLDNSPAKKSGVKMGDVVLEAQTAEEALNVVQNSSDVSQFFARHPDEEVTLKVRRGRETVSLVMRTNKEYIEGKGFVGVGLMKVGKIAYPWYEAPFRGFMTTVNGIGAIAGAFGNLIKNFIAGEKVGLDLAGPVGIALLAREASQLGFVYLLQFIAWISLHLALLNIVPFPALDGGRILFVVIEKIKGTPVSKKIEKLAHAVGFAFLITLIILITIRDIGRFF